MISGGFFFLVFGGFESAGQLAAGFFFGLLGAAGAQFAKSKGITTTYVLHDKIMNTEPCRGLVERDIVVGGSQVTYAAGGAAVASAAGRDSGRLRLGAE